jgi:hypothetical protein
MRYFSFAYHGLLALSLLGLAIIALASDSHTLRIDLLPWWKGAALTWWILSLALFALLVLILAVRGKLRVLFLAWSLLVFVVLVKGYVFSPYYFQSGTISTAAWVVLGALLALAGAWFQYRMRPDRKKLY